MSLEWIFPAKKVQFLRIELAAVGIISLLIFVLTYLQFADFMFAFIFLLIFAGIYVVLSYLTQLIRLVEEKYSISPTHFTVTRKTRFKTKKENVPLKDIKRHKLDHFFLGGYLVSQSSGKKKKHLLYFNTKKELKAFEDFLKKYLQRQK